MTITQYTKVVVGMVLLSIPANLWGQSGSLKLTGMMSLEDGTEYPYTLNLDVSGDMLKGVSVTRQDNEVVKMKVNGKLNRKTQMLVFTENAHMGKLPDTLEMCYISSILKWKEKKNTYLLTGACVAKKKNGSMCSEGKLVLQTTKKEAAILSSATDKKQTVVADTVKKLTKPVGENELTEGADKKLEWLSPDCVLEIWDAGVIDGDELSVLVNGKVLLSNFLLKGEKKKLIIPLTDKQTTLTFVAGSEGSSPPNTAQMILTDGGKQHKIMYYNKKGKTASIIIEKK